MDERDLSTALCPATASELNFGRPRSADYSPAPSGGASGVLPSAGASGEASGSDRVDGRHVGEHCLHRRVRRSVCMGLARIDGLSILRIGQIVTTSSASGDASETAPAAPSSIEASIMSPPVPAPPVPVPPLPPEPPDCDPPLPPDCDPPEPV